MKVKRGLSFDPDVWRAVEIKSRELNLSWSALVNRVLYRALIKSETKRATKKERRG